MSDSKKKWDFPASKYSDVHGFDTSDMETFRKDPIAGLARESVQNSIDAKNESSGGPVIVEFVKQLISVETIPGIEDIKEQLHRCRAKMYGNKKAIERIDRMEEVIASGTVEVLRISDHNTVGLTGIASADPADRWVSLLKNSGNSYKKPGMLGSKGIGKFASFVCSQLQMVFYSSANVNGEVGHEGVCRLCAATIPDSDDYTQGPGYFSPDEKHNAILEPFDAPWALVRSNDDPGTDLYIIGFSAQEGWEKEVVSNILESFVIAVAKDELVIKINDTLIDSNTLPKIVSDDEWISSERKNSILSQFDCLIESDSVKIAPVDLEDFPGQAILHIKKYVAGTEEEKHATKKCVLVRYPYMRIREYKDVSIIPCSALCILTNGKLADMLRDIENPQHSDWEPKRIEDPVRRKYVEGVIKELKRKIIEMIKEYLGKSGTAETDFGGAGEFLPDQNGNDGSKKKVKDETDEQSITREKEANPTTNEGYDPSEIPETVQPDIGAVDEDQEGDASHPVDENQGEGGNYHPGEGEGAQVEGTDVIFVRKRLGEMHWRFFSVGSKTSGKYCVYVVAPTDDDDCSMELFSFDDSGTKEKLNAVKCVLGEQELKVDGNVVSGFQFKKGQAYRFMVDVETHEYISGRVEFYANRKQAATVSGNK